MIRGKCIKAVHQLGARADLQGGGCFAVAFHRKVSSNGYAAPIRLTFKLVYGKKVFSLHLHGQVKRAINYRIEIFYVAIVGISLVHEIVQRQGQRALGAYRKVCISASGLRRAYVALFVQILSVRKNVVSDMNVSS